MMMCVRCWWFRELKGGETGECFFGDEVKLVSYDDQCSDFDKMED